MKQTPPITIWIHGTNLQQLLPGKLSDIQIEPFHKFMHCKPGLHHAKFLDSSARGPANDSQILKTISECNRREPG